MNIITFNRPQNISCNTVDTKEDLSNTTEILIECHIAQW